MGHGGEVYSISDINKHVDIAKMYEEEYNYHIDRVSKAEAQKAATDLLYNANKGNKLFRVVKR